MWTSLLSFALIASQAWSHPATIGHLDVATANGIVSGFSDDGVRQYLGIPFAQPPVGNLRWAPPQPLTGKTNIQAKTMPPACMQAGVQTHNTPTDPYGPLTDNQFLIAGPVSEDCLTLSIWAPAKECKDVPVFVWIHGGGFTEGGTSVPYQNPQNWIQRTQSHIVVSIQYRLGMFGFPNSPALTSEPTQNLAFLDQRLAIEWVYNNIAGFGGDPNRLTVWGQSAGAISTLYYAYNFGSDPLAQGFISDSGSVHLTLGTASSTAFGTVATAFGCSGSAQDELACLRKVDAYTLEAYLRNATVKFPPIVDNVTVYANYEDPIVKARLSDKPAILGSNTQDLEGLDICGQLPNLKDRGSRLTFQYQYRGNFTNISPRADLGAYHSSELPLIFGTYGNVDGPSTQFEVETSKTMQDYWLAFASDAHHGLPNLGWESYNDGFAEELGDTVLGIAARSVPIGAVTGVNNCTAP